MSAPYQAMPAARRVWKPRSLWFRLREAVIEWSLAGSGFFSVLITLAIAAVVIYGSYEFFVDHEYEQKVAQGIDPGREKTSLAYFFTGREWTAGFSNARYGILPLFVGTLLVALIAAAVAIPLGLTTAIYL